MFFGKYYHKKEEMEEESPKKSRFYLGIPWALRFSLIWIIFFGAIGVFIQYSKFGTGFFWGDFFTSNYLDWFADFGHFTDPTYYSDIQSVFFSILSSWYYFFYTGGLLAFIWELIAWIIHLEIRPNQASPDNLEQEKKLNKSRRIEKIKEVKIKEEKVFFTRKVDREDIEEWLDEAWLLISEGKVTEAEALYNQIRRYYDSSKDPERLLRASIMDLYLALVECKR